MVDGCRNSPGQDGSRIPRGHRRQTDFCLMLVIEACNHPEHRRLPGAFAYCWPVDRCTIKVCYCAGCQCRHTVESSVKQSQATHLGQSCPAVACSKRDAGHPASRRWNMQVPSNEAMPARSLGMTRLDHAGSPLHYSYTQGAFPDLLC